MDQSESLSPPSASASYWAGLDIGGTKTEAIIATADRQIVAAVREATRATGADGVLDTISRTLTRACLEAGIEPTQLTAIGVGIPGQIDPQRGVVELAVNLQLEAFALVAAVSARFGRPVVVENDVHTAALGAYDFLLTDRPPSGMVYLSLGTGVGASIIIDGQIYRGQQGMAGEIGHVCIDPDGVRCNCGQRGCLETIVSGPGLMRQFVAAGGSDHLEHAGEIFDLAAAGHPVAQQLVDQTGQVLATAIQWLMMAYDPAVLIMGGGLTRAGAKLFDPVDRQLATLRRQSPLNERMLAADRIRMTPLGFNAGSWGAVRLAQLRGNHHP